MKRLISNSVNQAAAVLLALGCLSACAPTPPKPTAPVPAAPAATRPKPIETLPFVLPTHGHVLYRFDGKTRKGIGIGGAEGTPVVAAADGVVVYAGPGLRAYGNMIILKHNEVFLTAYAHSRKLLVKEDQQVTQGQTIAEMGSTASDVTKLHFEIRKRGVAVDPETYLAFPGIKPPRAKAP
jgi:lipoprotein NlpD